MQHPHNSPNQKSHIPRYLTVQLRFKFKLRFWLNLNLYRGIWVSRFGGCRGSIMFSGNCLIISANGYRSTFSSVSFRGTNAPLFNHVYIYTYMKIYAYTCVDIYVCVYVHMCVCMYICAYICINSWNECSSFQSYIHTHIYENICIHICGHTCVCMCTFVCVYVYLCVRLYHSVQWILLFSIINTYTNIFIYIYIHTCGHIRVCIYISVCTYMYLCVYMCVYTHTSIEGVLVISISSIISSKILRFWILFKIIYGKHPHTTLRCSVLQCVAVCCSVLQCVAAQFSQCLPWHPHTTLQHTVTHCNTLTTTVSAAIHGWHPQNSIKGFCSEGRVFDTHAIASRDRALLAHFRALLTHYRALLNHCRHFWHTTGLFDTLQGSFLENRALLTHHRALLTHYRALF